MFLDRIMRRQGHVGEGFPWTVPLIANLQDLASHRGGHVSGRVRMAAGKSTLLEGMAWGVDATAVGSHNYSAGSDARQRPALP